jgi:hypothetical protein
MVVTWLLQGCYRVNSMVVTRLLQGAISRLLQSCFFYIGYTIERSFYTYLAYTHFLLAVMP